jgi:alpha-D-ribose 1-methylphosphonate 5-triphosphate synthase subunit PhnL
MDEPTASLDEKSTATALAVLNALKAGGTTMIGAFHDIRLMKQIADVIYDLDEMEA